MKPHLAICTMLGSPLLLAAVPAPSVFRESSALLQESMPLVDGWQRPPLIAQARVWWCWLNGNTGMPTITRLTKGTPLEPSGLLGPVRLLRADEALLPAHRHSPLPKHQPNQKQR